MLNSKMGNINFRDIYLYQKNVYVVNNDTETEKLKSENAILKAKVKDWKEKLKRSEPTNDFKKEPAP